MKLNYRKWIVACFAAACTLGTSQAGVIYTINATTTEGTAVTGTASFDTGTQKFTDWDIIAAADPGARAGGIAGPDQWSLANTTFASQHDQNGFTLVNSNAGNQSNFLILAFLSPVTGTFGESQTIWSNLDGGSYRFGSAIENLGAGCCQTQITGTITAESGGASATPQPSTWGMLASGCGLLALVQRKRRPGLSR